MGFILLSLNPRFVGQVFRHVYNLPKDWNELVLIPDLWGKSSDVSVFTKDDYMKS